MASPLVHEIEYRGMDLVQKLSKSRIVVCGAGAVGSNLIDNLCRQGFKSISVIDFDRVEEHNVGTQVYSRKDVGSLKVDAIQSMMFRETGVSVVAISKKLDAKNAKRLIGTPDCVIDAFDNAAARLDIKYYTMQSEIPCLHVGLDAGYGEVCWNEQYHVPSDRPSDNVGPCDYPMARNIVLLASTIATETLIDFIDTGSKRSYDITLRDRVVRVR